MLKWLIYIKRVYYDKKEKRHSFSAQPSLETLQSSVAPQGYITYMTVRTDLMASTLRWTRTSGLASTSFLNQNHHSCSSTHLILLKFKSYCDSKTSLYGSVQCYR